MNLKHNQDTIFYIPDNYDIDKAIIRTTHMAIAAHPDDIEIMAYDGISKCFQKDKQWFFAVIVTNGDGSPRNNIYTNFTREEMQKLRLKEQKKAAFLGEYGALALLNYKSNEIKSPKNELVISSIKELILNAQPEILYTHNPADKHETHIAVAIKVINALRILPAKYHPQKFFGCEVWRNLDWLCDSDKIIFDTSKHPNIASSLIGVFDSQISGGKRYDLATISRQLSNATYFESHNVDISNSIAYGMDLTPLIKDVNIDLIDYINQYIDKFKNDVNEKLSKLL